jgi:type IV secretion system protein VirD4
MLPQELKELESHRQIIAVENVRPILCEKARYFEDPLFIGRLSEVSTFLAGLDTRSTCPRWLNRLRRAARKFLPDEAQLKHAAFVLHELSAPVPLLDVAPPAPQSVGAKAPASAGQTIDLSLLASSIADLPTFADQEAPTPEEAARIVDAMFRILEVSDLPDATGLLDETETAEFDAHAPGITAANEIERAEPKVLAGEPKASNSPVDLSVLDE